MTETERIEGKRSVVRQRSWGSHSRTTTTASSGKTSAALLVDEEEANTAAIGSSTTSSTRIMTKAAPAKISRHKFYHPHSNNSVRNSNNTTVTSPTTTAAAARTRSTSASAKHYQYEYDRQQSTNSTRSSMETEKDDEEEPTSRTMDSSSYSYSNNSDSSSNSHGEDCLLQVVKVGDNSQHHGSASKKQKRPHHQHYYHRQTSLKEIRQRKYKKEQQQLQQQLQQRRRKCRRCLVLLIGSIALGLAVGFVIPIWMHNRNNSNNHNMDSSGDNHQKPINNDQHNNSNNENENDTEPTQQPKETPAFFNAWMTTPTPTTTATNTNTNTNTNDQELLLPLASTSTLQKPFNSQGFTHAALLLVRKTIQQNLFFPAITLQRNTANNNYNNNIIPFMDTPLAAYDQENPYTPLQLANKYPQGDVREYETTQNKRHNIRQEADRRQYDSLQGILYLVHAKQPHAVQIIDTVSGTITATVELPITETVIEDDDPLRFAPETWLWNPYDKKDSKPQSDQYNKNNNNDNNKEWTPSPTRPHIEQILITQDSKYLLVIASDMIPHRNTYTYNTHSNAKSSVMQDYGVTKVFTYEMTHTRETSANDTTTTTTTNTTYLQVGPPQVIHGRLMYAAQAQALNNDNGHIHIVTSTNLNTDRFLQDPLQRVHFPDITDAEYAQQVLQQATDRYIPLLQQRLLTELYEGTTSDDVTLLPVCQWIQKENTSAFSSSHSHSSTLSSEHFVTTFNDMHLQHMVFVTSFTLAATNDNNSHQNNVVHGIKTLTTTTAMFTPPNTAVVDSNDRQLTLVVSGFTSSKKQQQQQDDNDDVATTFLSEATHLVVVEWGTFVMEGRSMAASRFQSMTTVLGRVDSPRQNMALAVVVAANTTDSSQQYRVAASVRRQWKIPSNEKVLGKDSNSIRMVVEEETVAQDYIHVVDVTETGVRIQPQNTLELFANNDSGFMGSIRYLLEKDLAYVFPMEPPNPRSVSYKVQLLQFTQDGVTLLGEMDVPNGLSPHMTVLHDDILVSIGENKTIYAEDDTTNRASNNLVVSLWDSRNPLNLRLLQAYNLEAPSSLVQWKPKHFRISPSSKQLILPLRIEYFQFGEAFDGFVVLNVNAETGITEHTLISHTQATVTNQARNGLDFSISSQQDDAMSLWAFPSVSLLTMDQNAVIKTRLEVSTEQEWVVSL